MLKHFSSSADRCLLWPDFWREEGSIFVSHYQHRPFPNSPHPAPSSQVLLAFHPLQLGADEAAQCHHTAVALQKDKHQLTQKRGIPVSCSIAENTSIAWLSSSHSVILDSVILKVFSHLNDSLSTCLLISTGQKKWGDTLGKYDPLSSQQEQDKAGTNTCSGQHLFPSITEECHWAGATHPICPLQAEQGLHLTTSPELAAEDSGALEVFKFKISR